ncbi:hypothetical protein JOE23_000686 [Amphibacillus cookii]|nr:hypothetical protein [Amphibacillus cookii]
MSGIVSARSNLTQVTVRSVNTRRKIESRNHLFRREVTDANADSLNDQSVGEGRNLQELKLQFIK